MTERYSSNTKLTRNMTYGNNTLSIPGAIQTQRNSALP